MRFSITHVENVHVTRKCCWYCFNKKRINIVEHVVVICENLAFCKRDLDVYIDKKFKNNTFFFFNKKNRLNLKFIDFYCRFERFESLWFAYIYVIKFFFRHNKHCFRKIVCFKIQRDWNLTIFFKIESKIHNHDWFMYKLIEYNKNRMRVTIRLLNKK